MDSWFEHAQRKEFGWPTNLRQYTTGLFFGVRKTMECEGEIERQQLETITLSRICCH